MGKLPRYCPQRPLPANRYVPGHGPRPGELADRPTWNGDPSSLGHQELFRLGVDLFNAGYFWEAHEAWELLWRLVERETEVAQLLQGLIQWAGAALKAATDQPDAARRLGHKAVAHLARAPARCAGIDAPRLAERIVAYLGDATGRPPGLRLLEAPDDP